MKAARSNHSCVAASILIEAVIAMGVLATAIPLGFGVLAEAGKCTLASQAETRSTWIIPACMDEIHASRDGCPRYFPATTSGQTFPLAGERWALAFSPAGNPVGSISRTLYDRGTRVLDGQSVSYIVSMDSTMAPEKSPGTPLMRVHLSLEYPAAAPAAMRRKLDFHTRIP